MQGISLELGHLNALHILHDINAAEKLEVCSLKHKSMQITGLFSGRMLSAID